MKTLRCRLTRDGTESPGGRTPRYRRQASMAGVLSRRCLLVSRRRAVGGGSNIPIGVVEIIYLAILYVPPLLLLLCISWGNNMRILLHGIFN